MKAKTTETTWQQHVQLLKPKRKETTSATTIKTKKDGNMTMKAMKHDN